MVLVQDVRDLEDQQVLVVSAVKLALVEPKAPAVSPVQLDNVEKMAVLESKARGVRLEPLASVALMDNPDREVNPDREDNQDGPANQDPLVRSHS